MDAVRGHAPSGASTGVGMGTGAAAGPSGASAPLGSSRGVGLGHPAPSVSAPRAWDGDTTTRLDSTARASGPAAPWGAPAGAPSSSRNARAAAPSLTTSSLLDEADAVVREYLGFRGFGGALLAMAADQRDDALGGLNADRLVARLVAAVSRVRGPPGDARD